MQSCLDDFNKDMKDFYFTRGFVTTVTANNFNYCMPKN